MIEEVSKIPRKEQLGWAAWRKIKGADGQAAKVLHGVNGKREDRVLLTSLGTAQLVARPHREKG